MNMSWFSWVCLIVLILGVVARFFVKNETGLNADDARKLTGKVKARKKEWNWLDTFQMNRIEIKIERNCKKGCREVTLNYSLRDKVVEKLRENGYKVLIQCIDTKPLGTVIEW